ncbi:cellulose binding, type IV [Novosphingobium sp. Rr 2-17]|nr:cellulose binding, type IV [Novosphingobium sp. Rr 2-17]
MGLAAVAVVAISAFVSPAQAAPDAARLAAAQEAQERGAEMFAYDQAAWHATDKFRADMAAAGKQGAGAGLALNGYVVEPQDGARLLVSFYGEVGGRLVARARYRVAENRDVEGGLLAEGEDAVLSPVALRMIAARDLAMHRMQQPGHGLCSKSPANTLVLPPRADGVIPAYVMTSTVNAKEFPAGGHYRFDIALDGTLKSERGFTNSCFPIAIGKRKDRTEAVFMTHLLDSQPTEIHAFVSRNIPFPLIVIIVSNGEIWSSSNGDIAFVSDVSALK